MNVPHLPTAEGKRRYALSNGYMLTGQHGPEGSIPCTCTVDCLRGCDGRCGCKACNLAFAMYADEMSWLSPEGLAIGLDDAMVIWGECWPPLTDRPAG